MFHKFCMNNSGKKPRFQGQISTKHATPDRDDPGRKVVNGHAGQEPFFFIGGTDSIYKAYKKGLYKPEIWYVYVAP
jgi:hypothetical protein